MNTLHNNENNSYLKIWSLPIFGTLQHICANTVQRAHIPTSSTTKRGVAEGTLHDSTFFKKIPPAEAFDNVITICVSFERNLGTQGLKSKNKYTFSYLFVCNLQR